MDLRIVLESVALALFLGCWLGYESYLIRRSRLRPGSTRYSRLIARQARWIDGIVGRDEPLLIIHSLRTISRQVILLASLSLAAVAGAFGLLLSADEFQALSDVTRVFGHPAPVLLQWKILLLVTVVAVTFLNFVWGLRAIVAAHLFTTGSPGEEAEITWGLRHYFESFQRYFRHGLRGSYYAIDLMVWLFNTELFILTTVALTITLARYDFLPPPPDRPPEPKSRPRREAS
jgi:uncharacterized membrane protein